MGRRIGRARRASSRKAAGREHPFLLRHPRSVLAVAVVLLAVLAVIGTGTEDRLDPTTLDVPGTASSSGNQILREHFGDSAPFAILLRGPAGALDEQGPALIEALREDPRVTTLSPWDTGSVERLRPTPRKALIIADFHVDTRTSLNDDASRPARSGRVQPARSSTFCDMPPFSRSRLWIWRTASSGRSVSSTGSGPRHA